MEYFVERLKVNYKTLAQFKKFKAYGQKELSMQEDLEANIIENNSDSPFYGIYFGNQLVARMSLYFIDTHFDYYFNNSQTYLELLKLEVLAEYQGKGYGTALVSFAKSFNLPIVTKPILNSNHFWEKLNFSSITDETKSTNSNLLIWHPANEMKNIS
ncbi:N-acetyltransferase [Bacillus sp. 03113]|uniref:N-acetyltransferase n=1 Tax=Bacillus sp. 03113 TaxID=2578211 RepID=UPI0011451862|nr:N-acetyltransferase [Bacillus sp. 03113]